MTSSDPTREGVAATKRRRISPYVARDLLARHMWIAAQLDKGVDGIEAAMQWDEDELLTDTYEEYEAMATDAIFAAMQAKEDEASVIPFPRPLDYGNGKTREQEAQDSVQMLGLVLLLLVVAVCVAVAVVLWA